MMKTTTTRVLGGAVIALSLLACGGGPEPAASPAPAEPPPPPFTAAQIRDASPVGRTYVQRMSVGGDEARMVIRFVEVDADGATLESEAAAQGVSKRSRLTWSALAGHGAQPPGAVRREAPCEVPAGRFDCIIYEAVVGGTRVRTSFARSLPGMPVRIEQGDGEGWVTIAVLEAHDPGQRP